MDETLGELEEYLNNDHRLYPDLVELAIIHYQFEAIHPFEDGNGRIGRLLVALLLGHWQIMSHPALRLSPFFEVRKSEYVDALLDVSQNNNWNGWIELFLTAVRDQARDSIERATLLFELREHYRGLVQSNTTSNIALDMVDRLFERSWVTSTDAARSAKSSWPAAMRAINKLAELGILVEVTEQKRHRVWTSIQMFAALQLPKKDLASHFQFLPMYRQGSSF